MYEADDEPEESEGAPLTELETDGVEPLTKPWADQQRIGFETDGRYIVLSVDGKKVSAASGAYAKKLEERIEAFDREFLRIKSQMKAMRALVNRHEGDMNDVWRELDRKINQRDLP